MSTEFGIITVGPDYCISGRVFAGLVRRGTRFVCGYQIQHTTPDVAPIRTPVAELDLKIVRIECYGRDVDQLDEGLTGNLIVEGRGIELLSSGMSIGIALDSPPAIPQA